MVLVWPDVSKSLWNSVSQNEEDFSCMFDETTPLKACGDLTYNVAPIGTDCITLPPPPHPPKWKRRDWRLETYKHDVFHFSIVYEILNAYI